MKIRELKETLTGYAFIGPLMIGLIVLTLFPILASFVLSFSDWNFVKGFNAMHFIGFKNYNTMFHDQIFVNSLRNNIILILAVPLTMAASLVLAVLINNGVYLKDTFKILYFMPYISSVVAVAIVFQVLFHPTYGPINQTLKAMGVSNPPSWLADSSYAIYPVIFILIWTGIGYNLIIYLAGLQSIPKDLYEAADIDGASNWRKFMNITIPMLSPTNFFLMVTGIMGSFKVFDLIMVLTTNGNNGSSTTPVLVYYLYNQAFINLKSGYASAVAVILFLCIMAITVIQFIGQKKWVNY